MRIARNLADEKDLNRMQQTIADYIRLNVRDDLQAVLKLDRVALDKMLVSVFSDEKAWIAIAATAYALTNGGAVISAGAAIAALSNIGAKAFKVAREKREMLRTNNYALLYYMRH